MYLNKILGATRSKFIEIKTTRQTQLLAGLSCKALQFFHKVRDCVWYLFEIILLRCMRFPKHLNFSVCRPRSFGTIVLFQSVSIEVSFDSFIVNSVGVHKIVTHSISPPFTDLVNIYSILNLKFKNY